MTENELIDFPLRVQNRIPNFKGNSEAAHKLAELEVFKKAKTVKVNPDKAQQTVRYLCLEGKKDILVPIPRLTSGLFLHVVTPNGATEEDLKTAMMRRGFEQWGKPLGLNLDMQVYWNMDRKDIFC